MHHRLLVIALLAGCDGSSIVGTAQAGSAPPPPQYCDIKQNNPGGDCIAPIVAAPVPDPPGVGDCSATEMWVDLSSTAYGCFNLLDYVVVGHRQAFANKTRELRATDYRVDQFNVPANFTMKTVSSKPNAPQGLVGCWCRLTGPQPDRLTICAGAVYGTEYESCGAWVQLEGARDFDECSKYTGGSLSGSFQAWNAGWHTVNTATLTCEWAAYLPAS